MSIKPKPNLTFEIRAPNFFDTGRKKIGTFCIEYDDQLEIELSSLRDQISAGEITQKKALIRAKKLQATSPDDMELQYFMGTLLWDMGLTEESAECYEQAFIRAKALIPKTFKGRINYYEDANRSFFALAHGTVLALMNRGESGAAMALAKQTLAWCPNDNIGIRFLLADISSMSDGSEKTIQQYLETAPKFPSHWYQAGLLALRNGNHVPACTYFRRGIAANVYVAEGLTGRTLFLDHLHWHSSNRHSAQFAVDYLESKASEWTATEIDFLDWVFNSSPVLKERAELMALNEGLTDFRNNEKRLQFYEKFLGFSELITDTLSKKMVRRVVNRRGVEVWPWDRRGLTSSE